MGGVRFIVVFRFHNSRSFDRDDRGGVIKFVLRPVSLTYSNQYGVTGFPCVRRPVSKLWNDLAEAGRGRRISETDRAL